ncbi:MAG: hypothetical protein ACI9QD_000617 [Thermoproteota archaeon]|jgi:hypothetical protein
MHGSTKSLIALLSLLSFSSCSLFGIQSEEGPKYKVLDREANFEIRQYMPYIVAEASVEGNYDESSGDAFRILAGYIFGKNKGNNKISMTSPVESKQEPYKIAMTAPVTMYQSGKNLTMSFSMPSKYTLKELPKPLDSRIKFREIKEKVVAVHRFSWLSSKDKNDKKAKELRQWLKKSGKYTYNNSYSYAGYNPPWTIPFLRRNEVLIQLQETKDQK